jgi:hypothetical protein
MPHTVVSMTEPGKAIRIWHPMFDPYHCGFRMLRLLFAKSPQEIELLFILDFYLLFPFLLHAASMPEAVRARFRELRVERQQEQFVQVPSPQSLYRDLSVIQRTSLAGLVARGLVDPSEFQKGIVRLDSRSVPAQLASRLMDFLVNAFANIGLLGPRGLRNLTGLIRRTPS